MTVVRQRCSAIVLLFVLIAAGCSGGSDEASSTPEATVAPAAARPAAPTTTEPPPDPLRLNHVQVLGSHNSYHIRPRDEIFSTLLGLSPELAESIEYTHLPLTEQLDQFGIRQFELDVFADPQGGLYTAPAVDALVGLATDDVDPALAQPGYKVLHTQDFDYATTCLTLVACLSEIDSWSTAHPNHLPIMIMLEYKWESVPDAAAAAGLEVPALAWTEPFEPTVELLDALDAEIQSVFGEGRIIVPDDVRGDATTIDEAVTTQGWPELDDARGKVLFTMTNESVVPELYLEGRPNLEGRVIFPNSRPGQPEAGYVQFNDPTDPAITAALEAGYLVRTRTDTPTADARANNTTRQEAALASGAHYLSTDYYTPSVFFDSPYVASLPGGVVALCNPVTAPPSCTPELLVE